ncbi:MAG: hypothetical protein QMD43_00840 [Thermodesulfovibrio sp.]|uniref:hypothetical protein n=1 Tax=Thermodesulfovibrio sp. N1 TaxID=1871110 RepID=UPI00083B8636|nr:hypothetical protein [Thermodesulfovibrio sp. N1]MDI6713557.1 hypothetical protein [Thermodesulfovibrio sp.]ODA43459.1 hypothetical protein THER_1817 [Thermodesulfovibrio sp. N1]
MKKERIIQRIKWDYEEKVKIPEEFKIYLWEYEDIAPLEILIRRVLKYGNFEEIRKIYEMYPDKVYKIALKYPDTKRGVKFWIKKWKDSLN